MFSRRNHPARRARWIAGCIGTSTFVVATGTIGVQQAKASAVSSTDTLDTAELEAPLGDVELGLDGGAVSVDTPDAPVGVEPVEPSPEEVEQVANQLPAPELPAPELPAPELPAPELPAPELPAPELPAPELPAPELPAPELPAPEPPAPEPPTSGPS